MRILLVAPPGAGKGTQATRMASRYGITHISSGDLLRRHIERGTAIGREVKDYLARGDLVPDSIVVSVLAEDVLEAAEGGGYVIDGFPRTVAQAELAYDLAAPLGVEVQLAITLEVPPDELLRRLQTRGNREGRVDDTEATIRHRLEVFDEATLPLLGYYEGRGILHRVDGTGPPDSVSDRIFAILDDFSPPT